MAINNTPFQYQAGKVAFNVCYYIDFCAVGIQSYNCETEKLYHDTFAYSIESEYTSFDEVTNEDGTVALNEDGTVKTVENEHLYILEYSTPETDLTWPSEISSLYVNMEFDEDTGDLLAPIT